MSEDAIADLLAKALKASLHPHKVERKRSLVYDLSFDHKGIVSGVDPDTGEAIRGRGKGFEQDILVFDEVTDGHTAVVPRVVAEVKLGNVNTHDVIVYSEKADRIRRVYPYIRYGFVLIGLAHIPGRVLRLGQRFDFIVAISEDFKREELNAFSALIKSEAAVSVALTDVLWGGRKIKALHKNLVLHDSPAV